MPPVRTDGLNSAPTNGDLPYNIPVRMSPIRAITFAPNVAAETYNEPPELIVPPESTLFPSANISSDPNAARKTSHSKKKPDDWIPRPPNAFILFRSEFIKSQHVPGDVEANHGNLSKIIGLCWRNLPFAERDVWECKARIAMAEHKAKYPNYRFRPSQQKDKDPQLRPPKRRVKEPPAPPDEQRCAEIASLLVEGMKGEKLASRVRELDAVRPPEAVRMRFDEPVTPGARVFRGGKEEEPEDGVVERATKGDGEGRPPRSSSAPVPEAEELKYVPQTPVFARARGRTSKPRAASSSPAKKRTPRAIITDSVQWNITTAAGPMSAPVTQGQSLDAFLDPFKASTQQAQVGQVENGEDTQYITMDQYNNMGADAYAWTPTSTPHTPLSRARDYYSELESPHESNSPLSASPFMPQASPAAAATAAGYEPASPVYGSFVPQHPPPPSPTHAPVPRPCDELSLGGALSGLEMVADNYTPGVAAEFDASYDYAYPFTEYGYSETDVSGRAYMYDQGGAVDLEGLSEYQDAVQDLGGKERFEQDTPDVHAEAGTHSQRHPVAY